MTLTTKQIQLVQQIDKQAKQILSEGGSNEELLMALYDVMAELKDIISFPDRKKIDALCHQYEGFYHSMKALEQLAANIASGKIKPPQGETQHRPSAPAKKQPKADDVSQELNKIMADALLQLRKLSDISQQPDLLTMVKTFLLGVISTAVDVTELAQPGSAPLLYADIEAIAKLGGLHEIKKWSSKYGSLEYSVSNIAPDDMVTGMNYLGEQLSIALFKGLHELPLPLRNEEMMLRSVEVLLANLLSQKFGDDAPRILDSLCEHVHMALTDLGTRAKH